MTRCFSNKVYCARLKIFNSCEIQILFTNYSSIHSIVFLRAPALFLPSLPISSLDSNADKDDHLGPNSAANQPSAFLSPMFPKLCNFWRIYQQILSFYSGSGVNSDPLSVPLAFAEQKFHELFSLADKLNRDSVYGHYATGQILLFQ